MTSESDRPSGPPQDLGFGRLVIRESRKRLLNRDGTFNVRREGLGFLESYTVYEYLITIGWTRSLILVSATYAVMNALFAFAYWACGPEAIAGRDTQAGPFARTAEDLALLLNAMAGHDPRDSTSLDRPVEDYARLVREERGGKPLAGVRIGLPAEYSGAGIDPDVRAETLGLGEFDRLAGVVA